MTQEKNYLDLADRVEARRLERMKERGLAQFFRNRATTRRLQILALAHASRVGDRRGGDHG